jgi:hypothetical protein
MVDRETRRGTISDEAIESHGVQTIVFVPNPSTIAQRCPRHGKPFGAKELCTPFDPRLNRTLFRRTVQCAMQYERELLTIQNTRHYHSRCSKFVRNVSSMTAADVFSRQMQTILV